MQGECGRSDGQSREDHIEAMLAAMEPQQWAEQWAESEDDPDLQDGPVLQLDIQVLIITLWLCIKFFSN